MFKRQHPFTKLTVVWALVYKTKPTSYIRELLLYGLIAPPPKQQPVMHLSQESSIHSPPCCTVEWPLLRLLLRVYLHNQIWSFFLVFITEKMQIIWKISYKIMKLEYPPPSFQVCLGRLMTSEEFHDTNCLPDLVLDGGVEASFLPGRLKSPILFNSWSKALDAGFFTGVDVEVSVEWLVVV